MSSFEDFSDVSVDIADRPVRLGLAGDLMRRLLSKVQFGSVKIMLPSGALIERTGPKPGPEAVIVIRRWSMLGRLLTAGDIGFAEGFIDGEWTTPDLTALIRFAAQNRDALAPAIAGSLPMRIFNRVRHLLNANTKRGSRRNIEAHYDLGNEFYKQWLDASMLYSSGIFDAEASSLEAAQLKKLDRIADRLDLKGGESVLEIGCGWGALCVHLAKGWDARMSGITLSPSQLAWAKDTVHRSGISESVDLRLQDYRDTHGQFDRIVSIEMFEAVGEAYWPSYFETLKRCLKPGGRAVLQIISIDDTLFETYRRGTDFIQKYIFPGGFLPSDRSLDAPVASAGLKLVATEHFGQSYAQTLAEWRLNFHARWSAIAALGFDERFRRLWHYYLCYCEAGFEERTINVGLYTLEHA
jgi:cyclopropane-fatty-acyl-phospholipid synthase